MYYLNTKEILSGRFEWVLCVILEVMCIVATSVAMATYDPAASGFSWLDLFCVLGIWFWPIPVLHLSKKLLLYQRGRFFYAWIVTYLFHFLLLAISGMFKRPDVWCGSEGSYFPYPGDAFWGEVIFFFWLGIVNLCHSVAVWLFKYIVASIKGNLN